MKPTPTRRAARAVPVLLTLLAGCSSGTTSGAGFFDAGAGAADGGDAGSFDAAVAAACEPGVGKARGATQSCCPDLGIDACGPLLACAALDGRTVPVCYPEKSRTYGATCTSDALCMTSHCNPATQTCDGGPGCPPCGATKTCPVEIYRQMCGEPMRAPDETKSRTVELEPNGTDGSCVFKAFTKQAIWDFFKGM